MNCTFPRWTKHTYIGVAFGIFWHDAVTAITNTTNIIRTVLFSAVDTPDDMANTGENWSLKRNLRMKSSPLEDLEGPLVTDKPCDVWQTDSPMAAAARGTWS